jgi:hypothetical protein
VLAISWLVAVGGLTARDAAASRLSPP